MVWPEITRYDESDNTVQRELLGVIGNEISGLRANYSNLIHPRFSKQLLSNLPTLGSVRPIRIRAKHCLNIIRHEHHHLLWHSRNHFFSIQRAVFFPPLLHDSVYCKLVISVVYSSTN